jgi:hypothetical protein
MRAGCCAFNPKSTNKRGRAAIARALEDANVRAKLSPDLIKELRPPVDRPEAFCWDTEFKGWGVRLLRSGTASWVTQARVRGQPVSKRGTFGRVGRLPFTLARERAREILALADLGRDWYTEQRAQATAEQAAKDAETVDTSLGAKLEDYLNDPEVKKLRTYDAAERYLQGVGAVARPLGRDHHEGHHEGARADRRGQWQLCRQSGAIEAVEGVCLAARDAPPGARRQPGCPSPSLQGAGAPEPGAEPAGVG